MWSGNFIFAGYCVLNSRSEAVEETSYFGSIYLQKMNRTQRSVGSVDSEHIGQQYCSWSRSSLAKDILRTNITIDTCSFLASACQFNLVHQRQVCFWSTFPETNEGLYLFEERERRRLANCPAVFLSYFSLWICYEIQPAVGTPYTAVQNVWTISPARNHQFESSFWLKRLAIYM